MSERYVKQQRRVLERHILPDPICSLATDEVIPRDVRDFRQRLLDQGVGARTCNIAVGILKTAYQEEVNDGKLVRNPAAGVMPMAYDKRETGTFTQDELEALFRECPGVFDDELTYTAFLVAATTGMRRGEVLGLTWGNIDFENNLIYVMQQVKPDGTLGPPMWQTVKDKPRRTFLAAKTADALKVLRTNSLHVMPDALIFCYADGTPRQPTWWKGAFERAMIKAGFFPVDTNKKGKITKVYNPRQLKPHSLRHSLQSILADAGQDQVKARAAFGWASTAVQAGYTHADTFDLSPLKTAVDDIFKQKE